MAGGQGGAGGPAANLIVIAVSCDHAGKGLGADSLADALRRIVSASRIIVVGAVMVHARDDAGRRFYPRCAC